jgi:hypothetical protein
MFDGEPPEKPSLDDEHCLLDFGCVPRFSRPRRHGGVGAVDEGIIETGLDNCGLGVVGRQNERRATDRPKGPNMGVDPIHERLRPGRSRKSEAPCVEHGDEDFCLADFSGQPIGEIRTRSAALSTNNLSPAAWGCRIVTGNRNLKA